MVGLGEAADCAVVGTGPEAGARGGTDNGVLDISGGGAGWGAAEGEDVSEVLVTSPGGTG